jgi:hypothetical protein
LIQALALILGSTRDVDVTTPYGVAHILFEVQSYHPTFSMSRIGDLLFKGLDLGVGMSWVYVTAEPTDSFTFGSAETTVGSLTGWGDSESETVGGALASIKVY